MKLRTFMQRFSTDEACRAHLESVRWPKGPVCDRCGSVNEAAPVGGRPGFWQCRPCGKQFSVTAGTPMHGTHLPLHVWYLAMYLILASSKGISAVKLGEQLGVQYRTAWHLGHRIRAMLASGDKVPLQGLVEADETYVGGKAANLPKSAPRPEKRGRGTKKPMLFAAIEREGEARTLAIPSASAAAIDPALWAWTKGGATLITDELPVYRWIGRKMEGHHRVTHSKGEYARTDETRSGPLRVHTNTAEGFFGLFKRAVVGVWHQVSPKHLHRYASEHEFRYNARRDAVEDRIARCLLGSHGRLRLRELLA
jgi:transposase-like protein